MNLRTRQYEWAIIRGRGAGAAWNLRLSYTGRGGGDGMLLHVMHDTLPLQKPIYGMNSGTVGFLLNEFNADDLEQRIQAANLVPIPPLLMQVDTAVGDSHELLAFNEVALWRQSGQSANLRLSIAGRVALEKLVGDGLHYCYGRKLV